MLGIPCTQSVKSFELLVEFEILCYMLKLQIAKVKFEFYDTSVIINNKYYSDNRHYFSNNSLESLLNQKKIK